jgi:hypothetical protein
MVIFVDCGVWTINEDAIIIVMADGIHVSLSLIVTESGSQSRKSSRYNFRYNLPMRNSHHHAEPT